MGFFFLIVKVSDWDSPLGSHHSQTEVLPEVSVRADPSPEQTQQQLRGSIKCSKRPQRFPDFPPKGKRNDQWNPNKRRSGKGTTLQLLPDFGLGASPLSLKT